MSTLSLSRIGRAIWLAPFSFVLSACCLLSSCTFRAPIDISMMQDDVPRKTLPELQAGDLIELKLRSGRKVTGEIVQYQDDTFHLRVEKRVSPINFATQLEIIPIAEVDELKWIDAKEERQVGSVIAVLIVTLVGIVAYSLYQIGQSLSGLSGLN